MDTSWCELISLLRGNEHVGDLVAPALCEVVNQDEASAIFHELVTLYLVDTEWNTRANTAVVLRKLCSHLILTLKPLLLAASSDGELLSFTDVEDVDQVLSNGTELRSHPTTYSSSARDPVKLYGKNWIGLQRKALKKRIGAETTLSETRKALGYSIDATNLLEETDICSRQQDIVNQTEIEVKEGDQQTCDRSEQVSSDTACETWFVRLIRFLVVGLLDPRWETRQGCAMGLSGIINGLFPFGHDGVVELLPSFLVEDFLCSGLSVLILDRFYDCSSSVVAISPVKESISQLVAVASKCAERGTTSRVLNVALAMAKYQNAWMVQHGGQILLKYLVPLNPSLLMDNMLSECIQVALNGMSCVIDDVACSAAQLVRSLETVALSMDSDVKNIPMEALFRIVESIHEAIYRVDELSESPRDISRALASVVRMIPFAVISSEKDSADIMCDSYRLIAAVGNACALLISKCNIMLQTTRANCEIELMDVFSHLVKELAKEREKIFSKNGEMATSLLGTAVSCLTAQAVTGILSRNKKENCFSDVMSEKVGNFVASMIFLSHLYLDKNEVSSSTQHLLQLTTEVFECTCSYRDKLVSNPSVALCVVSEEAASLNMLQKLGIEMVHEKMAFLLSSTLVYFQERGNISQRSYMDFLTTHEKISFANFLRCCLRSSRDMWAHSSMDDVDKFIESTACSAIEAVGIKLVDTFKLWSSGAPIEYESNRIGLKRRGDEKKNEGTVTRRKTAFAAIQEKSRQSGVKFRIQLVPDNPSTVPRGGNLSSVTASSFDMNTVTQKETCTRLEYFEGLYICLSSMVDMLAYEYNDSSSLHDLVRRVERIISSTLVELRKFGSFRRCLEVGCKEDSFSKLYKCLINHINAVRALVISGECHNQYKGAEIILSILGCHAEPCDLALPASLFPCFECTVDDKARIAHFSTLLTRVLLHLPRRPDDTLFFRIISKICSMFTGELLCLSASQIIRTLSSSFPDSFFDEIIPLDLLFSVTLRDTMPFVVASAVPYLHNAARMRLYKADIINILVERLCEHNTKMVNFDSLLAASTTSVISLTHGQITTFEREIFESFLDSLDCHYEKNRQACAHFHLSFLRHLQERELTQVCYPYFLSSTIRGIGDQDVTVRRCFTQAFAILVPLAPLVKEFDDPLPPGRNPEASDSKPQVASARTRALFEHILFRSTPPSLTDTLPESADHRLLTSLKKVCPHLFEDPSTSSIGSRSLRRYQWDGISWLTQLQRCGLAGILADDMGLGKSVQSLTALAIRRLEQNMNTQPSLIVCPASLVTHWERELRHFFPVELFRSRRYTSDYAGGKHATMDKHTFGSAHSVDSLDGNDVVIVSYTGLMNDTARFSKFEWESIILDEAHIIRNPATRSARSVMALRGKFRIALSGTPIQNKIDDVWSLMQFLIPDLLGDYDSFRQMYLRPISRAFSHNQGRLFLTATSNDSSKLQSQIEISADGLDKLRTLHKQILPFILRRTKDQVAKDLPPKTIIDVSCTLSEEQNSLYTSFQRSLQISDDALEQKLESLRDPHNHVGTTGLRLAIHPFKALMYLQLLCIHPALVVDKSNFGYRDRLINDTKTSGKMTALITILIESRVLFMEERINWDGNTREETEAGIRIVEHEDNYSSTTDLDSDSDYDKRDNGETDDEVEEAECKREKEEKLIDTSADVTTTEAIREIEGLDMEMINTAKGWDVFESTPGEVLEASTSNEQTSYSVHTQDKKSEEKEKDHHSDQIVNEIEKIEDMTSTRPKVQNSPREAKKKVNPSKSIPSLSSSGSSRKCLIFCQHRSVLDIVENCVMKRHFPSVQYKRLDGTLSPLRRSDIVEQFQSSDTSRNEKALRILLLTTRACGLGLTLTAADTVIFIEHDWNPHVDLQAMDRAHRIGQSRPVTVYRLIMESSIEARCMDIQKMKKVIAGEVIRDADVSIAEPTSGKDEPSNGNDIVKLKSTNFGNTLWQSILANSKLKEAADEQVDEEEGGDFDAFDIENFLCSLNRDS